MLRLICIDGDSIPAHITVDGPLELGRDPHCDIRLLGEPASRYHLRVEPAGDGILLHDHQSRNGTWVGSRRVERHRLGDGQRFQAGGATFLLLSDQVDGEGSERVVADGGLTLDSIATQPAQTWQGGDDPGELIGLHALTRRLASQGTLGERARLLCSLGDGLFANCRCAVACKGTVIAGRCSPRLAGRLATGSQARLLALGRELRGHTIAAEAVGSAATVPLGPNCHLLVIRGLEDEPLQRSDLERLARIAGEVTPYFSTQEEDFSVLVGDSAAMAALRQRLQRLARVDATVLITGPSGSGKELVARCLHQASGRSSGPFIAVNCAAVAPSLFEAELFGHEKGAFSGADRARPGRIRAADGGTLFLDEVGELPLELQAKLLRVLQEGEVEPVGSAQPQAVNVRILSATNRDLSEMVQRGEFREDLFYRLDVLRVRTPALAERREDCPQLIDALLQRLCEQHQRPPPLIDAAALECLSQQPWPGNVRQLANCLERALVLADTVIHIDDLELEPVPTVPEEDSLADSHDAHAPFPSLAAMEARHVAAALRRSGGNRSAAARLLGISRPTLLRKIGDYGL